MQAGLFPILVLVLSAASSYALNDCDESFARAAKIVSLSSQGKVGEEQGNRFLGTLTAEQLSPALDRSQELTRVLSTRLGTPAELTALGDLARDGFEVYEVSSSKGTFVLKVFGDGGRKSMRQFLRELAVNHAVGGTLSQLVLSPGVDAFTLQDKTGTHPTLLMRKADGVGLDVLIKRVSSEAHGLLNAEHALGFTGQALADFHQRERAIEPSKTVRKEARELLKDEHLDKFRRWYETDQETPISVVDRLLAEHLLTGPQAKAFTKVLKEKLKRAKRNAPGVITVVHGDAKPSNFFFDKKTARVTAIDLETMGRTLQQTGDAAEDVGRMLGSLKKEGALSGLGGFEIKRLQAAFLDSYFHNWKGNRAQFKERVDFYELRYWGVTLADPNTKLTPEQRRRLAENLLDEAEISRPEVHALQRLLDAPYRDLDDVELPSSVPLEVGSHDSETMFKLAKQTWAELFDDRVLTEALERIKDKSLGQEDFQYLKALRKRAILLRSTFQVFDQTHMPPKKLHQFVQTFGEMNDAIANGKTKLASRAAEDVLKLVKANEPKSSFSAFKPATPASIGHHLAATTTEIGRTLAKATLTAREFHSVRKSVRQLHAFVRLLQASEPTEAKASALDYLHALNLHTGAIHDQFVTRSLNGEIDYEKATLAVPGDLRDNLTRIMTRLQIDP